MASYGQRGLAELLLGSETLKVLTHREIPVLVYRGARALSSCSESHLLVTGLRPSTASGTRHAGAGRVHRRGRSAPAIRARIASLDGCASTTSPAGSAGEGATGTRAPTPQPMEGP